jgi:hypothetical protein
MKPFAILPILLALLLTSIRPEPADSKICGISLVAPPNKVDASWTQPVRSISAEWVAVMPYAYSRPGEPVVHWDSQHQWWGESEAGARETIRHARQAGLNVMLKPMVWVPGGWPGGFELSSEEKWKEWEASYERYVMRLAKVAAEEGAQAFCIGTEFKLAATQRPQFWSQLAQKVRGVFSGKITYAANWDEFTQITFWKDLDYIGVDAYFPLSDATVPDYAALGRAWKNANAAMEKVSRDNGKQILFTEFGYRSVDKTAWKQWELENIGFGSQVNHKAQVVSYRALFENVWNKDWFAGGFLWQWYTNHSNAGGDKDSDYTPQNKPVEILIREWYSK